MTGTIDPMQDIGRAIDLYIGELSRRQLAKTTRATYRWQLQKLADTLPPYTAVSEITADDVRRFLDRWIDGSASTMGSAISNLRGFFKLMMREGHVPQPGPMVNIERPRRKRAEDLDVVTISERDANKLIAACGTWQELICLTTALYTGRRRAALNAALRRDVDLDRSTIRFRDKGDKVINQRIPREFVAIIRAADEKGVWGSPGEYLIPSRRPGAVKRKGLRDDSVIYDTVKIVADRAGVLSHVHALRAAFAVKFDDQHPDRFEALRVLMGHSYGDTTRVYLRRKDRAKDMESVDDLTWGGGLFIPESEGSNREEDDPSDTPGFAEVLELRPIRDSNPCSGETEDTCAESGDPRPSPHSALDEKLRELSLRATRSGRRVR